MKQQRSSRSTRSPGAARAGSPPRPRASGSSNGVLAEPHSAPEFPLNPALDFLQRLWQLNHALEQLSSQMERRIGVTAPQRMIIRCIGKYPDIAPSQLATVLHLDPGTVSATLSRLEDKGFVNRRRDSEDKRRVSLSLTTKGKKLDAPVRGTVESGMERLLAGAQPRDMAAARKLFEQLTGLLQDELATAEGRSGAKHDSGKQGSAKLSSAKRDGARQGAKHSSDKQGAKHSSDKQGAKHDGASRRPR